uniref:Uncharacterized protein n=1 Tax=Arundo donax TaxID=35708 RepID=A0A0A9GC66_ARUDO
MRLKGLVWPAGWATLHRELACSLNISCSSTYAPRRPFVIIWNFARKHTKKL